MKHDQPYIGNGVILQSHNTDTVLGTSRKYSVYVVEPDMPEIGLGSPQPGFVIWEQNSIEPVAIQGIAPPGISGMHYRIYDKG